MNRNYQKELERIILENEKKGKVPTLLLHSCCAPCSSYCIEYLSQFFRITIFYYNPNITDKEEYAKRVEEQKRFIQQFPGGLNCYFRGSEPILLFRLSRQYSGRDTGELQFFIPGNIPHFARQGSSPVSRKSCFQTFYGIDKFCFACF